MINLFTALSLTRRKHNQGTARDRVRARATSGARARTAAAGARSEPRLVPIAIGRMDALLRACMVESARGASFAEIYDDLLRPSALIDNGVATLAADHGVLRKVPLRNGGAVVFNESTRRWNIERRWSLRA
jgi:hypothetical protein